MAYFKFKTYFFFFVFIILLIGVFLELIKGFYICALVTGSVTGVAVYFMRCNFILKSVEEDKITIKFAYFTKQIVFKEIKDVECLDISEVSVFKDVEMLSINTKKNKYYEAFYSISSGDFEKIQEGVVKAQLQMGSSNIPE